MIFSNRVPDYDIEALEAASFLWRHENSYIHLNLDVSGSILSTGSIPTDLSERLPTQL